MDVFLIRHTRPDLDGPRCYGRLDADLCHGWGEEAAALRARLPGDTLIVTSPDRRCRQLAEVLGEGQTTAIRIDERLQELDFGTWEGLAWTDIPALESTYWAKDVWNRAPPGGETYAALHARVSLMWESLLLLNADRIALVGNGGPLRALLTIALELPRDTFLRFHIDHGSMTLLSDAHQGWRLEFLNRVAAAMPLTPPA